MAFSAAAKFANVARELNKVPSRVASQAAPAIERMWRKLWQYARTAIASLSSGPTESTGRFARLPRKEST